MINLAEIKKCDYIKDNDSLHYIVIFGTNIKNIHINIQ